jgi:hypothetical protein
MTFTNPAIIQCPEDASIGAVETTKKELSFLEYMRLVERRLLKLLIHQVRSEMNEHTDYHTALKSVAASIYQYLNFENKLYPEKEEDIVEEVMKSVEYRHWANLVTYRFTAIHPDVVTKTYPVAVSGYNKALEDSDYMDADFLDVLQALSSVYTITY